MQMQQKIPPCGVATTVVSVMRQRFLAKNAPFSRLRIDGRIGTFVERLPGAAFYCNGAESTTDCPFFADRCIN